MNTRSKRSSQIQDNHAEAQHTAYCSPTERRRRGVTFTPHWVVDLMVSSVRSLPRNAAVIDAGSGTGRFAFTAAKALPHARVFAIERNHALVEETKRLAFDSGLSIEVIEHDFLRWPFPKDCPKTVFLGNPPYVRHHLISPEDKNWLRALGAEANRVFSGLCGLHVYFLLHCLLHAREGDRLLMILPSEWLEARYGAAVKALLLDRCSTVKLYLFRHTTQIFAGTMTTSLILDAEIGKRPVRLGAAVVSDKTGTLPPDVHTVTLPETNPPGANWLRAAQYAVGLLGQEVDEAADGLELGELFSIHRGQVTGMNAVWIANAETSALIPARFLVPAVTDAREILDLPDGVLQHSDVLRRVIDLPVDLSELFTHERAGVERFLAFAEARGASETYIGRHRRAWWSVGLRPPPAIVMSYMARRPPGFALNRCQARILNIAHGLYPKAPFTEQQLARIVAWLNSSLRSTYGRTYAGGLMKIEPGDAAGIRIPALHQLGLARAA